MKIEVFGVADSAASARSVLLDASDVKARAKLLITRFSITKKFRKSPTTSRPVITMI